MSEKITWEDAVRQDVWLDEEHGKLLKTLEQLEERFGFDIQVAKEVYGNDLLEPEKGEFILGHWADFLTKIKENSGRDMVMFEPYAQRRRTAHNAAFIKEVSLEDISYFRASDHTHDKSSKIVLDIGGKKSIRLNNGKCLAGDIRLGISDDSDYVSTFNFDGNNMEMAFVDGYRDILDLADSGPPEIYPCLRSLAKEAYYFVDSDQIAS